MKLYQKIKLNSFIGTIIEIFPLEALENCYSKSEYIQRCFKGNDYFEVQVLIEQHDNPKMLGKTVIISKEELSEYSLI